MRFAWAPARVPAQQPKLRRLVSAGIGTYQAALRARTSPGSGCVSLQCRKLSHTPRATPPATRPAPALASANGTHTIAPGETIYSLGPQYGLTPMAIAKANNVGLDHKVPRR